MLRWLIEKDLRCFFADRNGALVTLATPVVLASLLGVLFAPSEGARAVEVLVVDLDGTPESARLVAAIDADKSLDAETTTLEDARTRVGAGKVPVALVIPKGAAAVMTPTALFGGPRLEADLLYDPSHAVERDLVEGLLTKITMEEISKGLSDTKLLRSMFAQLKAELPAGDPWGVIFDAAIALADKELAAEPEEATPTTESGGMQPPLIFKGTPVAGSSKRGQYNSYAHNFAGMLVLFLLFFALEAARGLLEERDSGVLMRVRLTPASRLHILGGRGLSTVLLALLMTAFVYAVGILVFGIRLHGSVAGFVLICIAQATLVGAFALFLCGVGRSEKMISSYGSMAVLVMSFAGGAMIPSFVMPEWIQSAARAFPTYWVTNGLAAMTWRALPLEAALLPAAVLFAMSAVLATIGVKTWRPDS